MIVASKFISSVIIQLIILSRLTRAIRARDGYYYVSPSGQVIPIYVEWHNEDLNLRCVENAEWTECVPPCPWTCQRIYEYQFFADLVCPGFCRPGCKCKFGYVLTEDYRCVSFTTCFQK